MADDGAPATEPRWLDETEREAWLATAAIIIKLPAALDAQLQSDAGLSFFEYMVMAALSEREDRTMQMSDIARFTSSSLSRLSHTAKRLEVQGYLERTQVPGPGRRTTATLTDAGYAKVVATAPGHVENVRALLIDAVSSEQLVALGGIGRQVLDRLGGGGDWPR